MRLNVKAFALAGGILWALGVFLLTVWYLIMGYEGATLQKIHHVYIGYSVSIQGAFIGLVWGFIDGFIGGALFSWLYNKLLPKPKA